MDEYKSRLSAYLTDMVREELEKYDGGFTDEWNDQRKKNAEVLGYKLSGKSDIKEGWWEDLSDKAQKAYIEKHGSAPNSSSPEPIGKYKKGDITKQVQSDKGRDIAKKMAGNMTGAVKKIEKIKKGLSDDPKVKAALRAANESINEELQNSQGEQTDFKKGDLVKDINPDCPHHGSEGKVTKVGKGTITFDVSNNGKNYQQGDELEKTVDQMVKLKESINEKMGPEQYHKYMQYVFDTQFKTPEEKKMKKSIIKKINKAQKKKGLPLFKESINEYTYGVGDVVKDINPTCPHNGAVGQVKSVSPKSVVFVVVNKGKNYKPGDILDKTHDQMAKLKESINEGFDKYHLGGLLDSKLKKRLERAIKIWGGKVDAVGDDYIKFRLSSSDVMKFPALLKKLDRKKNVWIGDKRKKNIWDRRQRINKLEATTTSVVSPYDTPQAFSKSTQNAIDIDDEDDEKNESVNESGILYKAGVKKYGKEGMAKILSAAGKKKSHAEIGAIKDKYEKDKKESVDELQMAPFSSSEARQHINQDIKKMSKELGKTSHDIIKMMMDGVKGGKYTAMDIARGVKEGPAGRAHIGELGFLQQLWSKVRDGFRRYSKDRKLS